MNSSTSKNAFIFNKTTLVFPAAFALVALIKYLFQNDVFSAIVSLIIGTILFLWSNELKNSLNIIFSRLSILLLTIIFISILFLTPENILAKFSLSNFPMKFAGFWSLLLSTAWIFTFKNKIKLGLILSGLTLVYAIVYLLITIPTHLYNLALIPLLAILFVNYLFYKKNLIKNHSQSTSFILTSLLFTGLYIVIFKCAWIAEDAFITLRTIENFVHGNGLRWNISERVQTYTHPLWMLLISFFTLFTHDYFYTTIFMGTAFTIGSVVILKKLNTSIPLFIASVLLLTFSKAFIDYSTSGLENSLSYFFAALFLWIYLSDNKSSKKLLSLSLITSLAAFNRIDTILIFSPPLFLICWQHYKKTNFLNTFAVILLGFVPLILWEVFSLLYYGFLFPNTAYAKLNTGYPAIVLYKQGLQYFLNSWQIDPITLLTIAFTTFMLLSSKQIKHLAIGLGILLYLIYIIKIGGDYMSGRFLALPFFISVFVLVSRITLRTPHHIVLVAGIFLLSIILPFNPWKSDADYSNTTRSHNLIIDERGNSNIITGLLNAKPENNFDNGQNHYFLDVMNSFKQPNMKLITHSAMGLLGFTSKTDVHIVDQLALCDPLLARLPARVGGASIGHFRRNLPDGYLDTLRTGEDKFTDRNLAEYYKKLSNITSGQIFSSYRINDIIQMNLGKYDHLINEDFYKYHKSSASKRTFLNPDTTDQYSILVQKGVQAALKNKWNQSKSLWEQAIQLDSNRPEAVANLGLYYEKTKQYSAAMQCYMFAFQKLGSPWDKFYQEVYQKSLK